MLTAPQLLAQARGRSIESGNRQCFYCGGACGESFTVAEYVAESFTERDAVAAPGSDHVCGGCVEALRSDLDSIPLISGETQRPKDGSTRGLQVRWFSWVISPAGACAATPAHRALLEAACITPPSPPFSIAICDGNKHQLFRTPVNYAVGSVSLNIEGTRVTYRPDELESRLGLTMRMVAACGKGTDSLRRLMDPASEISVALQMGATYDADTIGALFGDWRRVRNEPLTKLALWLCPGKEDAIQRLSSAA